MGLSTTEVQPAKDYDGALLHCLIESILTSSITVWYTAATAKDKSSLQRIICSAEKVIGCNLPSLQDLPSSRALKRAGRIMADPSHPGHRLFETLWQKAAVHQDQSLPPLEQFLPLFSSDP